MDEYVIVVVDSDGKPFKVEGFWDSAKAAEEARGSLWRKAGLKYHVLPAANFDF